MNESPAPPEQIGSGIRLTVEQCAAEFEGYAKGNPFPDRAYAYQHCADYLRENCVRSVSPDAERIAKIRKRVEKATPGPWDFHGVTMSFHISRVTGTFHHAPQVVHATLGKDVFDPDNIETGAGGVRKMQDADFIAHARQDVPYLLETIDHLRSLLDRHGISC